MRNKPNEYEINVRTLKVNFLGVEMNSLKWMSKDFWLKMNLPIGPKMISMNFCELKTNLLWFEMYFLA